ncbi:MaoC family dehydratase N-terminal domain-containing protein [Aeromonas salmonicida]|uniref:FAS1-like dehydratase domain-containing protein n=1 Tax=Aeromonas salmonicida TaxID=645 RepID=UPI0038B77706
MTIARRRTVKFYRAVGSNSEAYSDERVIRRSRIRTLISPHALATILGFLNQARIPTCQTGGGHGGPEELGFLPSTCWNGAAIVY